MSKLTKKLAATVPFAHLLGIRAESNPDETDEERQEREDQEARRAQWSKKAETDDERKQKDDESDDDYIKRMEKMDEDEEKEARSASGSDDDEGMEDEDEDAKAVRSSERARCARIIAHGIKNGCVNAAATLAFDTSMTSKQVIATLRAAKIDSGAGRAGLGSRMAAVVVPHVGSDVVSGVDPNDPQAAAKATANAIIKAAAKARGEKV